MTLITINERQSPLNEKMSLLAIAYGACCAKVGTRVDAPPRRSQSMDGANATELKRAVASGSREVALVVDLDRALRVGDPALEEAVDRVRRATGSAQRHDTPLDPRIVELARRAALAGSPVFLMTRQETALAEGISRRLGFVSGVLSSGDLEAEGYAATATALAARFPGGFDYVGSSGDELPIWRAARHAILARPTADLAAEVAATTPVVDSIPRPSVARELMLAARPHQWLKNLLVLVPLALSGQLGDPARISGVALAFLALCLVTGATYLVNDICDLPYDRRHWSKKHRPLASGRLPLRVAMAAAPLALLAGLSIGAMLAPAVLGCLLVYLAGTFAYSLKLKQLPVVDAVVLGGLFTIRLAVGIAAADVAASPWLLVFSMFLFTSLGFAKRNTELMKCSLQGSETLPGRGYRGSDGPMVLALGLSAALSAVVILVLYIIEDVLTLGVYHNKIGLWALPPLLYLLVGRIWLKSHRGEMEDDPVEFLIRDRTCMSIMATMLLCFAISWYGPSIR